MKMKFFILTVFFLGIGIVSFAQSKSETRKTQKEAQSQTVAPDQVKTTSAKAECTWVDANKDGLCDICGSKECKSKAAATAPRKSGCSPSCPVIKECGKAESTAPAKEGKKED
ncbi:MAG: hypothetical protein R6W71_02800 [Bacteroidales bacterium]|jgi:hypothetical protein